MVFIDAMALAAVRDWSPQSSMKPTAELWSKVEDFV